MAFGAEHGRIFRMMVVQGLKLSAAGPRLRGRRGAHPDERHPVACSSAWSQPIPRRSAPWRSGSCHRRVACGVPALRAARLDPMVALRDEKLSSGTLNRDSPRGQSTVECPRLAADTERWRGSRRAGLVGREGVRGQLDEGDCQIVVGDGAHVAGVERVGLRAAAGGDDDNLHQRVAALDADGVDRAPGVARDAFEPKVIPASATSAVCPGARTTSRDTGEGADGLLSEHAVTRQKTKNR